MRRLERGMGGLILTLLAATAALAAPMPAAVRSVSSSARPSKEGLDFFEKKIRPVLVHNCYECHSGDAAKAKGHLLLDSAEGIQKGGDSGAVVAPGHVESSLLIEAIRYEGLEMPPKEQLPEEVIDDFVRWIEMGAPDPRLGKAARPRNKIDMAEARKFWAFRSPTKAKAPEVKDVRWPWGNIDRFVLAKQEAERLTPEKDADRMTLIRRVTFDLTGLPPTPAEIDAFVKDPSDSAFASVVDRLLASPRFGERWGRNWLDVVRYAESSGKARNVPYRYAWRYRDYVIDSFNADKPFDRFLVEQLAGDLLPAKNAIERNQNVIATGFLALGPKDVNTKNADQFEMDVIDDQIDVTGRAMLGLTIACARCHDHKFDPIPTTDYYALAGIFHSTNTLSGAAAGKKSAIDSRLIALADTDKTAKPSAKELQEVKARQTAISRIESQIDGLRRALRQAGKQGPRNRPGKGQARRARQMAAPRVDQKQTREKIRELEKQIDELEALPTPAGNLAIGVQEAQSPRNCQVLIRGDLKDKGPEAPRGILTVLKTAQASQINLRHSGRWELAHWIADKRNPLTARVMVNRIWGHLFGEGLVDSVDNFGLLGNEPSNPELLDTLAVDFMEQGWSVKKTIRSIVLSHTYQLSSDHNADDYAHDPGNRYLWRMPRRRLQAEEIRDAILMASGQLDIQRPEGSPVMGLANGPIRGNQDLQEIRKPTNARSVYLPIVRGNLPEMLQVFDAADPNLIVGKRDMTTVPTQALFLMNSPFVFKQSEEMGKRVLADKEQTQATRIDMAYRWALGRLATDRERAAAAQFINDYRQAVQAGGHLGNPQLVAWSSFCQTLFEAGEFQFVY